VSVGIRPEHLLHGEGGEGCALHVRLRQMERLGDESLLYLEIGAEAPLVTLRVEGHATQAAGETVSLRLPAAQCHLFDGAGQAFRRTVQLPA
jgi:multiple sugar transport system ATP-binding protein